MLTIVTSTRSMKAAVITMARANQRRRSAAAAGAGLLRAVSGVSGEVMQQSYGLIRSDRVLVLRQAGEHDDRHTGEAPPAPLPPPDATRMARRRALRAPGSVPPDGSPRHRPAPRAGLSGAGDQGGGRRLPTRRGQGQ